MAVHKHTKETLLIVLQIRRGEFDTSKDRNQLIAQADEINVLIDLYFPRLQGMFESYRKKVEAFVVNKEAATFRTDHRDFAKDARQIVQEGENLKREIARLMHELEIYPPV
jgi:hypothetical protein